VGRKIVWIDRAVAVPDTGCLVEAVQDVREVGLRDAVAAEEAGGERVSFPLEVP
jgi:hypothetical protein